MRDMAQEASGKAHRKGITLIELDTIEQMASIPGGLMGRVPPYRKLVRSNGFSVETQT